MVDSEFHHLLTTFYYPLFMPSISLIIGVWNRADYVASAIKSVLNQTRGDFELIVWDDGSTDDSLAVAREPAGSGDPPSGSSPANMPACRIPSTPPPNCSPRPTSAGSTATICSTRTRCATRQRSSTPGPRSGLSTPTISPSMKMRPSRGSGHAARSLIRRIVCSSIS